MTAKKDQPTKTELLAERVYEELRKSTGRLTADDLAKRVGCTKAKVYLVVGLLRELMERQGATISNKRTVGYRIAGHVSDGPPDPGQQAIDTLMEATKAGERGLAHLRRQSKLLPMVTREMLSDPDQIELYAINVGMRSCMDGIFAFEAQLKQVAARATKKLLAEAKDESRAPLKSFGMQSFAELLSAARADSDDDTDRS